MKSYLSMTFMLGLAATAPVTQDSSSRSRANSKAFVRLVGYSNQHYSVGNTQTPSTTSGSTIPVLVGQSLDFSSDAPLIQEIELARVGRGSNLAGGQITDDDKRIICKASINGSSKGPLFSMEDAQVALDEGRQVKLTGLACWVERELM